MVERVCSVVALTKEEEVKIMRAVCCRRDEIHWLKKNAERKKVRGRWLEKEM